MTHSQDKSSLSGEAKAQSESQIQRQFSPAHSSCSRRKFVANIAALCGGLLSHQTLAVGVNFYPRVVGGRKGRGKIFSKQQMELLRELVETIIPATETLGAAGTDTHGFIDDQLSSCVSPKEARLFIQHLDATAEGIKSLTGKLYAELNAEQKNGVMHKIAEGGKPFEASARDFFRKLKAMTMLGYYTSEEGSRKELVYLPIAGGFDGNFKLSKNKGKAFSPAFY